jgi:alpha-aminoadipate carrier protein LysW
LLNVQRPAIQINWIAGPFYSAINSRRRTMATKVCVECGAELQLPEQPLLNEILTCPDCGVELEVISLEPIELALAPEIEEDWGE